jgi:hypothetical protein
MSSQVIICQLRGRDALRQKSVRSFSGPTLFCEQKNVEAFATRQALVVCEKRTAAAADGRRQMNGVWDSQIFRRAPSRRLDKDFQADGDHRQAGAVLNGLAAGGFFGAVAVAKWFHEQFGQRQLAGHTKSLAPFNGSKKKGKLLCKCWETLQRIDEHVCVEIRSTASQRV